VLLLVAMSASVVASQACGDGDVRYGEVGGLRRRPGGVIAGTAACPSQVGAPAVCPDWAIDIFPLFDRPPGTPNYGCMIASVCHGGPGSEEPVMTPGDPSATYDALAAFMDKEGTHPYIGDGLVDSAYILCNLDPTGQVNPQFNTALMPQVSGNVQRLTPDDFQLVEEWVACGMKKSGGTPGVGGGGGVGGAGGGL
jgi:hypothetical protein